MKAFLVLDELNQFHWAMLKSVLLILAVIYSNRIEWHYR